MMNPRRPSLRNRYLTQVRNLFLTGLFVTVPVFLTFWLLQWAFNKLDGPFRHYIEAYIEIRLGRAPGTVHLYGAGLVLLILIILFIGVVARWYAGKLMLRLFEALLGRVPVVNKVYHGIKQVTDAILGAKRGIFSEVVLVEYPRRGMWSLGFYTADTTKTVSRALPDDRKMRYVFIPTTPNPTSGYLLLVPEEEVYPVNIRVEDALKLIVSGGTVVVEEPAPDAGEESVVAPRPQP